MPLQPFDILGEKRAVEDIPLLEAQLFTQPIEIDESGECTVEVTYYGYRMDSPFEVEVRETQHWKRNGISNAWHVSPVFHGLDEARGRAAAR